MLYVRPFGDTVIRHLRSSVWPRIPTLRIPSVNRLTLDRELLRQFARLKPGVVLDVGAKAAPYASHVPSTRYLRLDVNPSRAPDICCDVHELQWPAQSIDTVLAIEILEHLYDPQRAIDRLCDVLRPGGVCILSTRFFYRVPSRSGGSLSLHLGLTRLPVQAIQPRRGSSPREPRAGAVGDHQRRWEEPRRAERVQSAHRAPAQPAHQISAGLCRVRREVTAGTHPALSAASPGVNRRYHSRNAETAGRVSVLAG